MKPEPNAFVLMLKCLPDPPGLCLQGGPSFASTSSSLLVVYLLDFFFKYVLAFYFQGKIVSGMKFISIYLSYVPNLYSEMNLIFLI